MEQTFILLTLSGQLLMVYAKTKVEPDTISWFLDTLQQLDIMQDIRENTDQIHANDT